ncbi:MAG: BrnA antitoxin family protein [Rhodopila sp.]|jgi:uncharacterized protein (DUF4415 family)
MKMAISEQQRERLEQLASKSDSDIDAVDIPEVLDWSGAVRGGLYRPRKETITIRLDADLLAWFRSHVKNGRGYQSEINQALRQYVAAREKSAS